MRRLLAAGAFTTVATASYLLYEFPLPQAEGPPYQELPKVPYSHHPNTHVISQVPKTIGIIGAGASGLITAKTLKHQGYSVEILEKKDHFGGVWYNNYDGAGLQVPFTFYEMPDFLFPKGTPFIPTPKQDEVLRFFQRYVEEFGLAPLIRYNSEVSSAQQLKDETWEVTLADGSKKSYDFLIVCNGLFHTPSLPSIPGSDKFAGRILHSSEFLKGKEICENKRVVVIGGGKSALDILNVASDFATSTTAVMRTIYWSIPLGFRFHGIPPNTLMYSRFARLLGAPAYCERGWVNWLLRPLGDPYYDFVGRLLNENLPETAKPTIPLREGRDLQLMSREESYSKKLQSGKILIKHGEVSEILPEGLVLKNGEKIQADVIVFATGFKSRYFVQDEQWYYRGMLLPGVRNYAIIGMMSAYFATMVIVNLQAVWLAEVLRGKVQVPSIELMKTDIQVRKTYTEKVVKSSKAPVLLFDQVYEDMLMTDMGLQTRRAKRYLDHWFFPTLGPAYRTVITHRV